MRNRVRVLKEHIKITKKKTELTKLKNRHLKKVSS
jgi:hypothetical protein